MDAIIMDAMSFVISNFWLLLIIVSAIYSPATAVFVALLKFIGAPDWLIFIAGIIALFCNTCRSERKG